MKIKLTIAGKVVELTVEEAKAIFAELAQVFGAQPVIIERQSPPIFVPYSVPVPQPIYHESPVPYWATPIVTCRTIAAA